MSPADKKVEKKKGRARVEEAPKSQLLSDLLETKGGRFGDPEMKLKKDIMKKLKVGEDEAFKEINLLAYSKIREVRGKLGEVKARGGAVEEAETLKEIKKRVEKTKKVKEGKVKEVEGAMEKPTEPVIPTTASLETEQLLSDLLETKGGRFGDPEMKLKKDIMKKLKVGEDEAFRRGTLLAYSKLKDVAKELEKLRKKGAKEKKPKKEGKTVKGGVTPKVARKEVIDVKGPMISVPITIEPEVSERAQRIAEVLEEQKRLEEEEAKKKKKKRRLFNPFKVVGRAINLVLGKIAHGLFVLFTTILSVPIILGKLIARVIGGLFQGLYMRAGRFSPFGWKKKINQLVIYSGINRTQEEITGITMVNGAILAGLIGGAGYLLWGWDLVTVALTAVASFGITWITVYAVINLVADKRTDEVEATLPDVLQIISANISAGMTPYNALWVSARKEFGALAEEIKIAQKETLGGKAFTDALTDMANRVRSNILQRTIRLIIQGMKAGGELPQILQGIATDIRQMRLLQKEMAANTMSYTLFILFGMILGAPLLFSVSIQFVGIINKFQPDEFDTSSMTNVQASPAMGGMQGFNMLSLGGGGCPKDFDGDGIPDSREKELRLNAKNSSDAGSINPKTGNTYIEDYREVAEPLPASCITPEYLSMFAMTALLTIAFFGSILVGLIRDGKQSAGLKLIPLLIPATLGMFWLMNAGMSFFFGSMFGT
jgi:hypothetical protein